MKLTHCPSAEVFLDLALEPLLQDEEENNLILGISMRVREGRQYGDADPLFLVVHDGDELVAAAIRTPPHNMILHCREDRLQALDVLADHLVEIGHALPGASGTVPIVDAFCKAWKKRTQQTAFLQVSQRIYALTRVIPPANVSGDLRWAQESDVPLLAKWFLGFCEEAVPSDPPTDPAMNVRRFIETGRLALWEDGRAVSMAGSSRGTPNGATVSAVYTPPEFRKHGYASACVAALSQALLADGNRFCTLYTDLSNPTSNKIYQDVGYRPIADCAMVGFEDANG